jgi:ubiquilin
MLQFKEELAKRFNAPPEQLCLIFAGKIMKDHETMQTHNLKDGLTIHLVIKTAPTNQSSSSSSAPRPPGLRLYILTYCHHLFPHLAVV